MNLMYNFAKLLSKTVYETNEIKCTNYTIILNKKFTHLKSIKLFQFLTNFIVQRCVNIS